MSRRRTKTHMMNERFLRGYAMLMTLTSAVFLVGAISMRAHASFDTIDVKQINIRDANGSLRLMLFGKDRQPPIIMNGKNVCCRRGPKSAGLMFYNDAGDEIGGLNYGTGPPGEQGQSLTFDAYQQDQVVQLWQGGSLANHSGGLTVNEVPTVPYAITTSAFAKWRSMPDGPARVAEHARLRKLGYSLDSRMEIGLDEKDNSRVVLNDRQGHARLRIAVDANGNPAIQFLAADGSVLKTITP